MRLLSAMKVIAHRGSSGTAPENTMIAFRRAVESGADMIELDVRLSADDELVVMHDRTLRRTTNGRGPVHRLSAAELQRLDAGGWYAHRYAGERVPTLASVLTGLPVGVGLNIEAKTDGGRRAGAPAAAVLAQVLRRAGGRRHILVSSFDHAFLKRFHTLDPATPIGVLAMPLRDAGILPSHFARTLDATAYVCSRSSLRRRFVRDAHRHGMSVYVYGVNSARHLVRPRRYGVDGVISNYPALMVKLAGRSARRTFRESP
jgi:glycerophosphoryl diester phosphodiesterase